MISKSTLVLFILYSYVFLVSSQILKPLPIDIPIVPIDKIDTINDAQKIETINAQRIAAHQEIQEINQIISSEKSFAADSKIKLDFYTLANTIFSSQKYFGNFCDRCKKLEYLSFRMGNRYLTAKPTQLKFQVNPSGSPSNAQLFTAEQQIDGTWAFKSLTEGKYIRADADGSTINYQISVGPWERWYMERHGNHVHVQSATFEHFYWISSSSVLKQLNLGANAYVVQHWPRLQWLWNW